MKRLPLLIIALLFISILPSSAQKIKIACIGNSITYGAGIENREEGSYPAQLQQILGDEYDVQNFGANARTALFNGNLPYVEREEYRASLEFQPDIVLLKLGTNDSKTGNFAKIDQFVGDYKKIVDSYQALDSKPRVILVTPLKCYLTEHEEYTISNERLVKTIRPMVQRVAYEYGLEVINGYPLCGDELVESILPDRLHPSAQGAAMMADHFAQVITASRDDDFDIFTELDGGESFNFHGFQGKDFTTNDLAFKVVQPRVAAEGRPWILRARFWGHEPQLDQRLLELGFHVAYCDVANLYGSDAAVERWDRFYKIIQKSGLNKRVVLEGMSRGGLIVYNWALKNHKKVAAIYADAPVLDLKSWPMGNNNYKGDAQRAMDAYGLNREQIAEFKGNPIDNAQKIAKFNIPIIHVVGLADTVVPYADNSEKFAQILKANGAQIEVIVKDGVGHHPHSLGDPKPIADFILKWVSSDR